MTNRIVLAGGSGFLGQILASYFRRAGAEAEKNEVYWDGQSLADWSREFEGARAVMMRLLRELVGAPFGFPAMEWMLDIGAFILRTEVELMIKSRRVVPTRLLALGFQFDFSTMREAFAQLIRED